MSQDIFPSQIQSPGGTTQFLRADQTWATVPAGADGLGPDGNKGDITVGGGGTTLQINAGAVALADMANVASGTVFYRKTASAGVPEVQTLATLKTDLGLTGTNSGDQPSIVGITGTLAQFNTAITDADIMPVAGGTFTGDIIVPAEVYGVAWNGSLEAPTKDAVYDKIEAVVATIPAAGVASFNTRTGAVTLTTADVTTAMPAFTGDVTSAAGATANTIAAGVVTLAKMANMATASLIYRKTAGSGVPEVQTLATLKSDLLLTGTNSGDQPSIVGITGTIAQFNTACTDADFATVASLSGYATTASLANYLLLTGGTLSGALTVNSTLTTSGLGTIGNGLSVTGGGFKASGQNLEFSHNGTVGIILSYDRTGSAYKALSLRGLSLDVTLSGTQIAAFGSTGLSVTGDIIASGLMYVGTDKLMLLHTGGQSFVRSQVGNLQLGAGGVDICAVGATGLAVTGGISTTSNMTMGVSAPTSGANPIHISMGGSFSDVAGDAARAKLKLFNDGAGAVYGLGVSSGQFDYMAPAAAQHKFWVGGVNIAHFSNDGQLGIISLLDCKTPNAGTTGGIRIRSNSGHGYAYLQVTDDPITAQFSYLRWNAAGQLLHSGAFTAAGGVSLKADERDMRDVRPIRNALALTKRLRGVRYREGSKQHIGIVGQELKAVLPALVSGSEDEDDFLAVDYGRLCAVLIEAVKTLTKRVEELEAR